MLGKWDFFMGEAILGLSEFGRVSLPSLAGLKVSK